MKSADEGGAGPVPAESAPGDEPRTIDRRSLLARLSQAGLVLGLTAAYGTLGAFMVRYLFPAGPPRRGWMFVTQPQRLAPGESMLFRTPAGATVNVARQGAGESAEDYIALSSTCPHLGCQVHWEPHNERFFCPCHNGVFDPSGKGIGGPPGEAGQSLPRYPLKVEAGLLYIEVPLDQVAEGRRGGADCSGCSAPCRQERG